MIDVEKIGPSENNYEDFMVDLLKKDGVELTAGGTQSERLRRETAIPGGDHFFRR